MYRLHFAKGHLKKYIKNIQIKLKLSSKRLAKEINISSRTLQDWKREKFNPDDVSIRKLALLSGLAIPSHKIFSNYWYVKKAAVLGGKRRFELYGQMGNIKSRSKGGLASWKKRKEDINLLNKFVNVFAKPKESIALAEFIGIVLGDGGITNSQCVIYLNSNTEREYAQYVKDIIYQLFHYRVNIHKKNNENVLRIGISGVNIVKYLKEAGLKVGNKVRLQVDVPSWIYKKEAYIKACIRGLIDTDGCFTNHQYYINDKKYSYLKMIFSNKSKPLLEFVYMGLTKLGFHPKKTSSDTVWLHNQYEVNEYLSKIDTHNIKPVIMNKRRVA